jgi:cytochrome b6
MGKVYNWFNERLEIQSIADDITSKYVPPHVNIFYCIGGITLTCFLVQVATGFAMTFYYRPTVTDAFQSVQYIMTDVNFGWLCLLSTDLGDISFAMPHLESNVCVG